MADELTACRKCHHFEHIREFDKDKRGRAYPRNPFHGDWCLAISKFDAISGQMRLIRSCCRKINTGGHCIHFEPKDPS